MAHFPLPFAVLPENYTKINKYYGFQGQNPWKIMFLAKPEVKLEVCFWPLYGGDIHILDQISK